MNTSDLEYMNQDCSQMVWHEYQDIEDVNKLLADMQGSRYKFMNISGLVKSTRLDENEVAVILNVLKSKSIIEEVVMNSHAYFKLTERGLSLRSVTNRLLHTEEPLKDFLLLTMESGSHFMKRGDTENQMHIKDKLTKEETKL